MAGKGQWFTPISVLKNKEEVWARIEERGWAPPKLDSKEITYFNNPLKYQWISEYDHFFAYTKVSPLWDKRKTKDNTQYLPDIHENIFQQEKDKPVPVLTSLNYGRPCRPPYDYMEAGFRKKNSTSDFYRKTGVMRPIERKVQ